MSSDKFLAVAIEEARLGLAKSSIPIGSVLVWTVRLLGGGITGGYRTAVRSVHEERWTVLKIGAFAGEGVSTLHDLYDVIPVSHVQRSDSALQDSARHCRREPYVPGRRRPPACEWRAGGRVAG